MAATAEATAEEVPNVELVVETATSCDRSRLCMRLPDRHLAYKGACILSAGQAQAGAITHVMRIVLLCGKLRTDQCLSPHHGVILSFFCRRAYWQDQAALSTWLPALYCLRYERAA